MLDRCDRVQIAVHDAAKAAQRFGHVADYVEYPGQGHWVLGQPGWERIAEDTVAWLDGKGA